MTWKIKVNACGWMLKLDPYGIAIIRVDAWAAHLAAQPAELPDDGCGNQHPDQPCDDEMWVVHPKAVESWLQAVEDGERTTSDLMTELELHGIGDEQ